MDKSDEDPGFDPTARRLCPDGACTGLLDASGRCHECGRSFDNVVALPFTHSEPDVEKEPEAQILPGFAHGHVEAFDPQRQLCPDGACTGIMGPTGVCSECGRTGAPGLQGV